MIGVDVGGTKLLAVRLEADGRVGAEVKVTTPVDGPQLMAGIAEVVDRLGDGVAAPGAIGVAAAGLVDAAGVLRFAPHLPGLIGTALDETLRARYRSSAVWTGNDAAAACWAEHLIGAAVGVDDVIMVTLGTGIGGGIIRGGVLEEGAHRFAGEFGHMVVDPHGPLCPCTRRGCWERYASGSGLGLLGREAAVADLAPRVVAVAGGDPEAVRGEHVTVAAGEGDQPAVAIMARFAWWVAVGLANLANIFDPALLVLGGGLVDAGEVLLGPTRAAFGDLVEFGAGRGGPPIRAAALGSRAGAVGAALLAAGAPASTAGGGASMAGGGLELS